MDDTLEALGTPKEYQQLYKWMIRVIIVWIVSSNLLNGLDTLVESTDSDFDIMYIYSMLMCNLLPHVDTINGLILGTILGLVHVSYFHKTTSNSEFEQVSRKYLRLAKIPRSDCPKGGRKGE